MPLVSDETCQSDDETKKLLAKQHSPLQIRRKNHNFAVDEKIYNIPVLLAGCNDHYGW